MKTNSFTRRMWLSKPESRNLKQRPEVLHRRRWLRRVHFSLLRRNEGGMSHLQWTPRQRKGRVTTRCLIIHPHLWCRRQTISNPSQMPVQTTWIRTVSIWVHLFLMPRRLIPSHPCHLLAVCANQALYVFVTRLPPKVRSSTTYPLTNLLYPFGDATE